MEKDYRTIIEAAKEAFPRERVTLARGNTFFSHPLKQEGFILGAMYVLEMLEKEFVSDSVPDNSSCCCQWEMKEFINRMKS